MAGQVGDRCLQRSLHALADELAELEALTVAVVGAQNETIRTLMAALRADRAG